MIFYSDAAETLGLAMHLTSEGHAVRFIMEEESIPIGHGLVERKPLDDNYDIQFVEGFELGKQTDELRKDGTRILGPSQWSDTLDSNKEYVEALCTSSGWDTNKTKNGINLYTTIWFNGKTIVQLYNSFVYKRFMPGGKGLDVGFSGSVSYFSNTTEKFKMKIIEPALRILRKVGHKGVFHIHSLIDNDRFSVRNLSASLQHPLSISMFENSGLSCADIILRLFNEDSKDIVAIEPWTMTILFSIPPFPYDATSDAIEIHGIQPGNLKHLWFNDAQRLNGVWKSAGSGGKVGYVTARGCEPTKEFPSLEASRRAYRTLRQLDIENIQYRIDIGKGIVKLRDTLKSNGWLN